MIGARLQALPTYYAGHKFRSRLEARWAVFFDALDIKWEYEPEGYQLQNGEWYLPDFWLPRFHYPTGIYVEVKPESGDFSKAIEFVRSGGSAILLAQGTPDLQPYRLVQPNHSNERPQEDCIVTDVAFREKYLRGGRNADEYRMFWSPHHDDCQDFLIDLAVSRARQARFVGQR